MPNNEKCARNGCQEPVIASVEMQLTGEHGEVTEVRRHVACAKHYVEFVAMCKVLNMLTGMPTKMREERRYG